MKLAAIVVTTVLTVALAAATALAFCGFYVARADTKLFNQASQVVLVRHENKTVITMANDFKGDPKEFAIVVPVPTILEKGQIRVGGVGYGCPSFPFFTRWILGTDRPGLTCGEKWQCPEAETEPTRI